MSKLGWRIVSYSLLCALMLLIVAFSMIAPKQLAHDSVQLSPSPSPSVASPPPSPPPPPDPRLANCHAQPFEIEPARLHIPDRNVDVPMMLVGSVSATEEQPGAPADTDGTTVAWYKLGPKVGSAKGNVILTSHTFSESIALGNQLGDPAKGLKPGEIFRISDAKGNIVCYRYTSTLKVIVKEYDKNSNVFFDREGKPQIAWMVCWDHNRATNDWDSRLIFYAEPVWQK